MPSRASSHWPAVTVMLMLGTMVAAYRSPGSAQEAPLPEPGFAYRVTGVAENDHLNMRAFAGTEADIVGSFSPHASGIVVTGSWEELGGSVWWELVYPNAEGGSAWVNSRFLLGDGSVPETDYPLECFGTEPFWSLQIDGERARYQGLRDVLEDQQFEASRWINAAGLALGFQFAIRLRGPAGEGLVAVLRAHGYCSDNMSNVLYRFYGTVILPDGDVLGGCCSRAAPF